MAVADLIESPIHDEAHASALLELAFAMSAVDGHLADEELASFREILSRVRGKQATDEDIGDLLEKFVQASHMAGLDLRAKQVMAKIPPVLRETAYSLAYALSLVDKEKSEYEDQLLAEMAKEFGFDGRTAEGIQRRVRDKLTTGS
jgi:uncharacterized tellurite resistance protein B-like protein